MLISVCIPVYNGAETIAPLVEKIREVFRTAEHTFEIVMVNDGSKDASDIVCTELAQQHRFITYVCLRKNSGEHNAVMCALNHCVGDVAVIIDDDFQNPPAEILNLVSELQKGFDVVFAKYHAKKHSLFRNLGSRFNDRVATLLLNKPKKLYLCSFKAVSRPVINEIIKYQGPFPYIDGLILRVTDSFSSVYVEHDERKNGRSNYTIAKLISLWLNMFINFSVKPLRIVSCMGVISAVFSFISFVFAVIEKIQTPSLPAGWTSTVAIILFLGSVQLISFGLIGEYIGKAYLDINGTPQWTVKKIIKASKQQR